MKKIRIGFFYLHFKIYIVFSGYRVTIDDG